MGHASAAFKFRVLCLLKAWLVLFTLFILLFEVSSCLVNYLLILNVLEGALVEELI